MLIPALFLWTRSPMLVYRIAMAFELDESRLIEAPIDRVWSVITDLPAYPEWNPFVVAARSTLVVGDPIQMRVRLVPPLVQPQREIIFECVPQQRLVYGLDGAAIRSRRTHELSRAGEAATRYLSHFRLEGRLAPLTGWLLGRHLTRGFESMTRELALRAETLHRAASGGAANDT
jgi:uncharacterized protein YndB with AHSA1/START domain